MSVSDQALSTPKLAAHSRDADPGLSGIFSRIVGSPWFWSVFVGVLFFVPLIRSIQREPPPRAPVLGHAPAFDLRDHDDRPYGSEGLKGRLWVVSPTSTTCGESCDAITMKLRKVSYRLRNAAAVTRILSVTTTPETDSPGALRRYIKERALNERMWRFLTGPRQQTAALLNALFDTERPPPGSLVLVDGFGRIRGRFVADAMGLDDMVWTLGLLLNERPDLDQPVTKPQGAHAGVAPSS